MNVATLQKLIGVKIRSRRQRLGWSQQDLADHSDIERANLTRLELGQGGEYGPSLGVLKRVADALQVDVRDLFPRT